MPRADAAPEAFPLRERVAVVTGAAGLLGRRHLVALHRAGAHVVAVDLDEASASAALAPLACGPGAGEALAIHADVTRPEDLRALRDRVLGRFDRVDVLVNSAALDDRFLPAGPGEDPSRFEELPLEAFRRALDVNVTGTVLPSQVLGTVMAERGGGSIVNIASTYGLVAPDQGLYRRPDGTQAFHKGAAYPVAKGAVLSFTRFLAAYWGGRGVRTNAISPGGVENGQEAWFVRAYGARTPLGRMARPDELEGALVFLASDASSYVTGANLVVDGGWTAW